MNKPKLSVTDSIRELAEFWDTHDSTDFDDELVEITEPVFVRSSAIKVPLKAREAKAVEKLAKAKGVSPGELVRDWVLKNLPAPGAAKRTAKRGARSVP
jgi:aryl-alcohol dehydrogenase-like predicted oxidoreductase